MYRENSLKKLLGRGQVAYGMISAMDSAVAAEMIGMAGYDYVLVDAEHGCGALQSHLHSLQAISSTPATALYRIESNDRTILKRVLDLGVEGVMVPSVSTADEARAAVTIGAGRENAGSRDCVATEGSIPSMRVSVKATE